MPTIGPALETDPFATTTGRGPSIGPSLDYDPFDSPEEKGPRIGPPLEYDPFAKFTTPSITAPGGIPETPDGAIDGYAGLSSNTSSADSLVRDNLFQGEDQYFKDHPEVTGMASDDDRVIINPYAKLTPEGRAATVKNETARVFMRQNGEPTFNLTPEQEKFLDSNTYKDATPGERRATIAARILSGDPSAGTPTAEQTKYVEGLKRQMGLRADGTQKGDGFLGRLQRPDGKVSTELSIGVDFEGKETEIPLLVPTLTREEITRLLAGEKPDQAIIGKAVDHAKSRMARGLSPFHEGLNADGFVLSSPTDEVTPRHEPKGIVNRGQGWEVEPEKPAYRPQTSAAGTGARGVDGGSPQAGGYQKPSVFERGVAGAASGFLVGGEAAGGTLKAAGDIPQNYNEDTIALLDDKIARLERTVQFEKAQIEGGRGVDRRGTIELLMNRKDRYDVPPASEEDKRIHDANVKKLQELQEQKRQATLALEKQKQDPNLLQSSGRAVYDEFHKRNEEIRKVYPMANVKDGYTDPGWWVQGSANAAESLALGILTGGRSAARGAVAGSLMEAAPGYVEMRDQNPEMGGSEALARKATYGAAVYGLEKIGLEKIFEGSPTAIKKVMTALTEGTTEYLENPAQVIADQAGREGVTITELGQQVLESLRTGADSFIFGTIGGAAAVAGGISQEQRQAAAEAQAKQRAAAQQSGNAAFGRDVADQFYPERGGQAGGTVTVNQEPPSPFLSNPPLTEEQLQARARQRIPEAERATPAELAESEQSSAAAPGAAVPPSQPSPVSAALTPVEGSSSPVEASPPQTDPMAPPGAGTPEIAPTGLAQPPQTAPAHPIDAATMQMPQFQARLREGAPTPIALMDAMEVAAQAEGNPVGPINDRLNELRVDNAPLILARAEAAKAAQADPLSATTQNGQQPPTTAPEVTISGESVPAPPQGDGASSTAPLVNGDVVTTARGSQAKVMFTRGGRATIVITDSQHEQEIGGTQVTVPLSSIQRTTAATQQGGVQNDQAPQGRSPLVAGTAGNVSQPAPGRGGAVVNGGSAAPNTAARFPGRRWPGAGSGQGLPVAGSTVPAQGSGAVPPADPALGPSGGQGAVADVAGQNPQAGGVGQQLAASPQRDDRSGQHAAIKSAVRNRSDYATPDTAEDSQAGRTGREQDDQRAAAERDARESDDAAGRNFERVSKSLPATDGDPGPAVAHAVEFYRTPLGRRIVARARRAGHAVVVFVRQARPGSWEMNGVVFPDAKRTIALRAEPGSEILEALEHEVAHGFFDENNETRNESLNAIWRSIDITHPLAVAYRKWYDDSTKALGGDPITDGRLREEITCDIVSGNLIFQERSLLDMVSNPAAVVSAVQAYHGQEQAGSTQDSTGPPKASPQRDRLPVRGVAKVRASSESSKPRYSVTREMKPEAGRRSLGAQIMAGAIRPPSIVGSRVTEIANYFTAESATDGVIDFDSATPEQNKQVEAALQEMLRESVRLHPGSVEWYGRNVALAMGVMEELDPDLKKPANSIRLKLAIALTSDGNEVDDNFRMGWNVYSNWKTGGKMVASMGMGERQGSIAKNLARADVLIEKLGGEEKAAAWLLVKEPVGDIAKEIQSLFGVTRAEAMDFLNGELVDAVVPRASVFGPKLGSFFNNLSGDFSTITMDLWFMRTIGRITGTLSKVRTTTQHAMARAGLRVALKNSPEALSLLGLKAVPARNADLDALAVRIMGQTAKAEFRDALSAVNGGVDVRLAGNYRGKMIKGERQETPKSGSHRKWMRERMNAAREALKLEGIDIQPADMQAALWYGEKEIYHAFGYRTKRTAADYGSAAESLYVRVRGGPSGRYAGAAGRVGKIGGTSVGQDSGATSDTQEAVAPKASPSRVTPAQDARYLELAKDPEKNAAELQAMVDEAAKGAGYNVGPLWHGGSKVTTYLTPLFISPYKQVSESFRKNTAYRGGDTVTQRAFVRANNPARDAEVYAAAKLLGIEGMHEEDSAPHEFLSPGMIGVEQTDRVIAELKKQGFDSAHTDGDFSMDDPFSEFDSWTIFDPSQIKSADAITRDDAGNVIPLSARFNEQSEDIRYSPSRVTRPDDARYLELAKEPEKNSAQLQAMVDQAAKAAGYVKVLRTIPRRFPAKMIGPGDWVSLDGKSGRAYQAEYAGKNWEQDTHVIRAYVDPSVMDDQETGFDKGQTLTIGRGGFDEASGDLRIDTSAVRESAIKSADPITRDDAGEIIPLSARFNEQSEDIKYSPERPGDGNSFTHAGKRGKVAVIDAADGHILEVIDAAKAQKYDYHHTGYLSDKSYQAWSDGTALVVWPVVEGASKVRAFTNDGTYLPPRLTAAFLKQIKVDPVDAEVKYSPRRDGFFSALTEAVEGLTLKQSIPGDQFLNKVKGLPGVKAQEIEESGFADWLAMQKENGVPVTKDAAAAFLAGNGVRVETVGKGAGSKEFGELKRWADDLASFGVKADVYGDPETDEAAFTVTVQDPYGGDPTVMEFNNSDEFQLASEEGELDAISEKRRKEIVRGMQRVEKAYEAFRKPGGETKFSAYAPPGGVPGTYREVLLTLPPGGGKKSLREMLGEPQVLTDPQEVADIVGFDPDVGQTVFYYPDSNAFIIQLADGGGFSVPVGNIERTFDTLGEAERDVLDRHVFPERTADTGGYIGPHWSEPNVLAHMLMDERRIPLDVLAKTQPELAAEIRFRGVPKIVKTDPARGSGAADWKFVYEFPDGLRIGANSETEALEEYAKDQGIALPTEARALHMIEGQSDLWASPVSARKMGYKPPLAHPSPRRLVADSKTLGDALASEAFVVKGLNGLTADHKKAVVASVVSAVGDDEIRRSVIADIPVDVVNQLRAHEFSVEDIFHDPTMLADYLSGNVDPPVALPSTVSGIIRSSAAATAKRVADTSELIGLPVDGDPAPRANGIGFHGESIQGAGWRVNSYLPFRGDAWKRLVIRKMLAEAVDGGYDMLTWSTGADRAAKWGSERVEWKRVGDGSPNTGYRFMPERRNPRGRTSDADAYWTIADTVTGQDEGKFFDKKTAEDAIRQKGGNDYGTFPRGQIWTVAGTEQSGGEHAGQNIEALARGRGLLLEQKGQTVRTKDDLRKIINGVLRNPEAGKVDKLTDRIWTRMQTEPEGTSMPRREFFEFLYDKSFVQEANDIVRRMDKGAREGVVAAPGGKWRVRGAYDPSLKWDTREEAEAFMRGAYGSVDPKRIQRQAGSDISVHAIPLTPSIKAAVERGQPLYSPTRPDDLPPKQVAGKAKSVLERVKEARQKRSDAAGAARARNEEEEAFKGTDGEIPPRPAYTGTKRSITDQMRERYGLEAAKKFATQHHADTLDQALKIIEEDPRVLDRLVENLAANGGQMDKDIPHHVQTVMLAIANLEALKEAEANARALVKAHANGDKDALEIARKMAMDSEEKMQLLVDIERASSRLAGLALNSYKITLAEDMSLGGITRRFIVYGNGADLTDDVRAVIAQISARYEKLIEQQQIDQALSEPKKINAAIEAFVAEMKASEPKVSPLVYKLVEEIVGEVNKDAEDAWADLRASSPFSGAKFSPSRDRLPRYSPSKTSGGVDPAIIDKLVRGAAQLVIQHGEDYEGWKTAFLAKTGPMPAAYGAQTSNIYKAAVARVKASVSKRGTGSMEKRKAAKVAVEKVMAGKPKEDPTPESVTARIREMIANGESPSPTQLRNVTRELARMAFRSGITDRTKMVEEVHKTMKDVIAGQTVEETGRQIAGYGIYKLLDKDAIEAALREDIIELQNIAKLEDMAAGKAPLRTGGERQLPSDEGRRLIQKVEEEKRKGGYVVTDPARELRTSLEASKRAVENAIADLEEEIRTKTPILKTKTVAPTDAELDALRKRRDELKKLRDAALEWMKPQLPGQAELGRIDAAAKTIDKTIEEVKRQIAEQDFSDRRPRSAAWSPKLAAKHAELDALRAQRAVLHALSVEWMKPQLPGQAELDRIAAKEKSLEKSIGKTGEKVATGKYEAKEGGTEPWSPKIAKQKAEMELLQLKARRLRQIADWKRKLANGEFEPKAKKEPKSDDGTKALDLEIDKVKRDFYNALLDWQDKNRSALGKAWKTIGNIIGTARAITTSVDLPPFLRQGLVATLSHPIISKNAWLTGTKAIYDEATAVAVDKELQEHPEAEFAKAAGLFLHTGGSMLSKMEEQRMSRWIDSSSLPPDATKGRKYAIQAKNLAFAPVRASQRGYTTYLNKLRFDMFVLLTKSLAKGGDATLNEAKIIANFINVSTGRGNLAALNEYSVGLATVFFAPRYDVSRWQLLIGQPLWTTTGNWKDSKRARILIGKQYIRTLVAGAALTYLLRWAFQDDDDDENFWDFLDGQALKILAGDTRIDMTAGVGKRLIMLSRIANSFWHRLVGGDGPDTARLTGRYFRGSLAPAPSVFWDWWTDKHFDGSDTTTGSLIIKALPKPLLAPDIKEAMEADGIPTGTAASILMAIGAGGNTYDPQDEDTKGKRKLTVTPSGYPYFTPDQLKKSDSLKNPYTDPLK